MASGGDGGGGRGGSPRLYPGPVLSPLCMLPHLILATDEKLKHGDGGSGEGWWGEDRQLALCTQLISSKVGSRRLLACTQPPGLPPDGPG